MLFGDVALQYHAQRDPNSGDRYAVTIGTYKRDLSQYNNDIAPYIAHLALDAVTPTMALTIAQQIEKKGSNRYGRASHSPNRGNLSLCQR